MKYYSNEIVFRGHPDKVCDQISDALLDAYIKKDPNSRCGIEVVGGKGKIFITGEVTSKAFVNVEKVVRKTLLDIGYSTDYEIINNIGIQSSDIALGTNDIVAGAGDNGMVFGFACNDNCKYLPTAMVILQELSKEYDKLRKIDNRFLPDGKAEIAGLYEDNKLVSIETFTICYQNTEVDRKETDTIIKNICNKICLKNKLKVKKYLINPTGRFLIGGFLGDAGLTGRKIVVDNYQSFANVGGGAFSGKDPTKVDRSAAYYARYVAKNLVAAGLCERIEIQVSYAIGIPNPVSIYINTFGTGKYSDNKVLEVINKVFDFSVKNIIDELNLRESIYHKTSKYGHFGINISYEDIDKVNIIKSIL